MSTITSSIKLNLNMIVDIKPYIILSILGQEFVTLTEDQIRLAEACDFFTESNDVGTVHFGERIGRIYKEDDSVYLRFEDAVYYLNVGE